MKTILKSGLALLLVLMMLIPVLASCNGSKDSGITPTGTGKSGETGMAKRKRLRFCPKSTTTTGSSRF